MKALEEERWADGDGRKVNLWDKNGSERVLGQPTFWYVIVIVIPQLIIFQWFSQVDIDTNMAYSANYADGSWTAVRIEKEARGNEKRGFNRTVYQEKFGKGCRNSTAHPHETVR